MRDVVRDAFGVSPSRESEALSNDFASLWLSFTPCGRSREHRERRRRERVLLVHRKMLRAF
jgi:hypothetical protein